MNSVSLSWSWYYINFANINKVKITSFNVLYWSLELLYSFGNLINDMNKKNSFSDSGYFLLRLPPTLCWRTRKLSTAWNRSTRLTSTKRPPSSASWGYWRRRMSPSLKRDPQGSDTPPPHWSLAVQQMFCDTDTVPDKRRICRIYSLLYGRYFYIEWWLVM